MYFIWTEETLQESNSIALFYFLINVHSTNTVFGSLIGKGEPIFSLSFMSSFSVYTFG